MPRYQWYQTPSQVIIDVFVKKAKEASFENGVIVIEEEKVELGELFGPFDSEKTQINLLNPKVEVILFKTDMRDWKTLQKVEAKEQSNPPAYPSSSKTKHDWDAINKKLAKKEEKESQKLKGDEALNHLLKDIYAKAPEETRRAMNKSYQESGGSTLSTNWDEVGKAKMEPSALKGTEVRDWKTNQIITEN
jgi:suppressor of G2 allele of SKP1